MRWRLKQKIKLIKNLKKLLSIVVLVLIFNVGFSQTNFQEEPKTYKKINFVYEEKSNYYIDGRGIFADTLLFRIDFPKLKYRKVKNPNDSTNVCGLVFLRDFKGEDKRKLVSIIYHHNQTYYGTYDVSKNKTTFHVVRDDTNARELFHKYFNQRYYKFESEIVFDFNKKIVDRNYPLVDYSNNVKDELQEIIYTKDSTSGTFKRIRNNLLFENIVILNEALNKRIMPNTIFSNNDFGVQKIITIHTTTTLKKVSYK